MLIDLSPHSTRWVGALTLLFLLTLCRVAAAWRRFYSKRNKAAGKGSVVVPDARSKDGNLLR